MDQTTVEYIFQANFRYLRRKFKITRPVLAEKLNVSHSSIGAYEEGRALPSVSNMLKLCDLFEIGLEALVTINVEKELTPTP